MDAEAVIGYTGVVALLTITPGLDMALVSRSALSGGRGAAFATTGGIVCGLLVWGCASAIGVAAVFAASGSAYDVLRLAGAAYLVWLGVQSLRGAGRGRAVSPPGGPNPHTRAFRMGLVTNLANPKIAVFYSTVLPTFIPGDAGVLGWSLALAGIHATLSALWLTAYAWLLTRARALVDKPAARRALEALTGIVLDRIRDTDGAVARLAAPAGRPWVASDIAGRSRGEGVASAAVGSFEGASVSSDVSVASRSPVGRIGSLLPLVLLACVLPASAQAAWSAPVDISGARAIDPQVAVDPSGNAVVVWENRNGATGIQARARSATGTLSDRQNLSPPGYYAFDPQAGIDQSGNAVFVWSRYDGSNNVRIEARARAAGGVLSKPQLLSAPGNDAHNPQVAVGPGGDAVFVWSRRDGTTDCGGRGCGRIQVRARSAAGVLSGVQTLSEPGQHAFSPQIGLDQTGNAVVVWSAGAAIRARARSSTGVLGAVQIISPTWVFGVPQLDIDQSGRAVIVWERFDASTDCDGHACLRIQTRARLAAGGLTAVQTVSAAGQTASHPQVAVDENGNAVFVWERTGETNCIDSSGDPTPCLLIQARARSAIGALSGGQTLSGVGQVAQHPQVAVDPSGKAVFVWQRYDGTTDCPWTPQGCGRIQSRGRTATGLLTATETLSAPAGNATLSQIGVDQAGNAIAVWQRFQANSFVQAATGP